MLIQMTEVPDLHRVVVARQGDRVLVLHPTTYDKGDLGRLLTPTEVALLSSAA